MHSHHDHAGHHHAHTVVVPTDPPETRRRQTRVLWIALAVNGVLLVAEAIGGIVFGSLALLADAAHMLSDVAGLGIALVAQHLMARPRSDRHTFGLLRAEALGAQANAVLLLASTGWILFEAFRRVGEAHTIEGGAVLVVATLGLAVNVGSAVALARVRGANLNIDGAYAHMLADAAGSVGAMLAGAAVLYWGAVWVDTAAAVVIAGLVLVSGWRLLAATTRVLMEAAPAHLDAADIGAALRRSPVVEDVHQLHLWSLSSDTPALSAHVVLAGEMNLHEAQERGAALRVMLDEQFGIRHTTLELECHVCE